MRHAETSAGLVRGEQADGWYGADDDRQVMVFVTPDGGQVRLLDTGRLRDRREVAAMYRTFLGA